MKKSRLYKKNYKKGYLSKAYSGILGGLLVLSTNLLSHSIKVSNLVMLIAISFVIISLLMALMWSTYNINKEIKTKKKFIYSIDTSKSLKFVILFGYTPIIPLVVLLFTKEENMMLGYILISIMLLVMIKYSFEKIVIFDSKGYSSGFDKLVLNSHVQINENKKISGKISEDIIIFDIYIDDIFYGYDRFYETDYKKLIETLNNCRKI